MRNINALVTKYPFLEYSYYGRSIMGKNLPVIKIGKGSWIGTHVAIIGDVHVGKHCVIGANSVVTKDVPDYSVAIGIPAKVIKKYNFEIKKWEKVR